VVVDCKGVGYNINISLFTFSKLQPETEQKIFIHHVVREDTELLFGFFEKKEREVFRLLISVSGVGANTARMMLSSLSPDEIQKAILSNDINLLKSIKGIGLKTAQRVILDLRDKLDKDGDFQEIFISQNNTIKSESLSALIMLGFQKSNVEKVLTKILAEESNLAVEEVVKKALKLL
jgi:Holliday junction DNA helicase RuvA